MKIVCIGWGSLIWKPGVLHCLGPWQAGGPDLPIEFARTSQDGRLTLVLTEGTAAMPTQWVELGYAKPEQAQEALAGREGSGIDSIGLWPGPAPKNAVGAERIADWAQAQGIDAVVWTALKPKFDGVFGQPPQSADAAVSYLRQLDGQTLDKAREYVMRAPVDMRTAFRAAFEAQLGWLPLDPQAQQPEVSTPHQPA
jgi:hypothetical protein